jgi:hypothetical protein
MTNKTATLKIERDKAGEITVFLDGMELETVDEVQLDVFPNGNQSFIKISLLVPGVEVQANIEDIQLTTAAYKRCKVCGKWIIPSIAKNLDEKIVTAEYTCNIPHPQTGITCNWHDSVKIQDWNNGIKEVKPITNMEADIDGRK